MYIRANASVEMRMSSLHSPNYCLCDGAPPTSRDIQPNRDDPKEEHAMNISAPGRSCIRIVRQND